MAFLPILYDKAKTDKIKCWQIGTRANVIVTQHGYIDGAITESTKTIYKGKNIGKKNETTPEQQAFREAMSKWQKQRDKGYVLSIDEIGKVVSYYPMLAKTYIPGKTKLPESAIIQPKLNGVRIVAVKKDGKTHLYSRNMKEYTNNLPELAQEINGVLKNDGILDGEGYKHGWEFKRIIEAVKQNKALVWRRKIKRFIKKRDWEEVHWWMKTRNDSQKIEYHVYDVPTDNCVSLRRNAFVSTYKECYKNKGRIKYLPGTVLHKPMHEDIKKLHDIYVKRGYEGGIIRDANAPYLWKYRGKELLKYKEFITDEEFKIVGYTCGSGDDDGAIIFKCHVGGPRTTGSVGYFNVRPTGSISNRKRMYEHGWTYIGQMLTVQYQERSVDNVPTFPVGTAIRNYE